MISTSDEQADRRRLLRNIMLAVLAWGSVIALGATLFGYDHATGDIRYSPSFARGAIVEGCVLIFLGGWWYLVSRKC